MPGDVREAEIAAGIAVREALVIHTEEVQDGGVEVGNVDFVFLGEPAVVIRGSVGEARLHTAASHPHGEAVGVVVATVLALCRGRAAKLATPDDECVIQQPT